MKKYEAVFILDIRKVDDEGKAFSQDFGALIESLGGKMEAAVSLGRKQFTYDINKRKAGIYWDFLFELDSLKVIEIKNKYKLNETVLRNLILINDRPEGAPTTVTLNLDGNQAPQV